MLSLNEEGKALKLTEYVLVIPSVSVGNVGQLTVDLLITTLGLKRIGYIRHKNIQPVIGLSDSGEGLATECELFASANLKIVTLQIRSSYGPFSSIASFLSSLCKTVRAVVILTGSFAYERRKIQEVDDPIRYLKTSAFDACNVAAIPENWKTFDVPESSEHLRVRVPGSGIADHLYHQCKEEETAAIMLVMFVSEGDNRGDAIHLATFLDSWLSLRKSLTTGDKVPDWKAPLAWQNLFGNTFPKELF